MTYNSREQLLNKITKLTNTLATKRIELTYAATASGRKTREKHIEKWMVELEQAQTALANLEKTDAGRSFSPLSPVPGEEEESKGSVNTLIHQNTGSVRESTLASEDKLTGSITNSRANDPPADPSETSLLSSPPAHTHKEPIESKKEGGVSLETKEHDEPAPRNEGHDDMHSIDRQPPAAMEDRSPVTDNQGPQELGMSLPDTVAVLDHQSSTNPADDISSTERRLAKLINTLDQAIVIPGPPSTQNVARYQDPLSRKIDSVKTIWRPELPKLESPAQNSTDELPIHWTNDDSLIGGISAQSTSPGPSGIVADAKEMVDGHNINVNMGAQTDMESDGTGKTSLEPDSTGQSNGSALADAGKDSIQSHVLPTNDQTHGASLEALYAMAEELGVELQTLPPLPIKVETPEGPLQPMEQRFSKGKAKAKSKSVGPATSENKGQHIPGISVKSEGERGKKRKRNDTKHQSGEDEGGHGGMQSKKKREKFSDYIEIDGEEVGETDNHVIGPSSFKRGGNHGEDALNLRSTGYTLIDGKKKLDDEEYVDADADASAEDSKDIKKSDKKAQLWQKDMAEAMTEKWLEKGNEAWSAWYSDPDENPLPPGVRLRARTVAEYCPQLATTCERMSLEVLTSEAGTTRCLAHTHMHVFNQHDQVGSTKGYKATGTPHPAVPAQEKPEEGFLHCRCRIDTALMELYFFKTGKIASEKRGPDGEILEEPVVEGWCGMRLQPCLRVLIFNQVVRDMAWSLDCIWERRENEKGQWVIPITPIERQMKFITRQFKQLSWLQAQADIEMQTRMQQTEEDKGKAEENEQKGEENKQKAGENDMDIDS
ncbi:hypothetical protein GYMLUDRAFT_62071 [Collybiopsis luxurians FD-317 M1]|uniref:Uncharacterized protein n=1 Tax=Collybiopsis luxurians FD-317 M1 TaxID=944289 RepID=A0A0D0CMM0_9AGAR|nr:hypothetical protein GYMLUDRAFT_62071 [Collybiopsis luxurians FD-317 M1]